MLSIYELQKIRSVASIKAAKVSNVNQGMASLAQAPSTMASVTVPKVHHRGMKLFQPSISLHRFTFPHIRIKHPPVCCTKLTPWEPSSVTYSPTEEKGSDFLRGTSNIFETLNSDSIIEAPVTLKSLYIPTIKYVSSFSSLNSQYGFWVFLFSLLQA